MPLRRALVFCRLNGMRKCSLKWDLFDFFPPPAKGFMFSGSLLVCCILLQRNLATTEGRHGTNRHVFYTVEMRGGATAVRALAEQHGLEFIQRVSAC